MFKNNFAEQFKSLATEYNIYQITEYEISIKV